MHIIHSLYIIGMVLFFFNITIFIHEFGHFWVARKRGLKVERFALWFGPALWKKTIGGIEYRLGCIPFGGYVMLPQMVTSEELEGKPATPAEQLPPVQPLSKILVALAGPIMNILLALGLACVIWVCGLPEPVNPSIIGFVEPDSAEAKLGIRRGDRIVQINEQKVKTWSDILMAVALGRGQKVKAVIERDGRTQEYLLEAKEIPSVGFKAINLMSEGRPYVREVVAGSVAEKAGLLPNDKILAVEGAPVTSVGDFISIIGKRADQPTELRVMREGKIMTVSLVPKLDATTKLGRIGVAISEDVELVFELTKPGPNPGQQMYNVMAAIGKTFQAISHSKETGVGVKHLSGPVGIVGGWWYEFEHGGILRGISFAIMLNLNLAVINLLPLPVLDGGHIVFSLIEWIRRKPLSPRFTQPLSLAFVALIVTLFLYITFFDVRRLTGGFFRTRTKPPPSEIVPAKP